MTEADINVELQLLENSFNSNQSRQFYNPHKTISKRVRAGETHAADATEGLLFEYNENYV